MMPLRRTTIDWWLVGAIVPIMILGLFALVSFDSGASLLTKQLVWIVISFGFFFLFSFADTRILKNTKIILSVYLLMNAILVLLFIVGSTFKGAQSWFDIGGFTFQPSDPLKIVLILILAKYLSRRHTEIKNFKHILVTGLYAMIPCLLVLAQPDFGTAVILFMIWAGMILVSGISKKHLLILLGTGAMIGVVLWGLALKPYQKDRLLTFLHPLSDIRGAGYNAYQSTVAVGSGQLVGKGFGFGTQSRLHFLPEYETDFMFAAFAEEWGFVGVIVLFVLYGIIIWRILRMSLLAGTNFEMLYSLGIAIFFISHLIINIGMNIGLMPVTGITLPFMSYGGSHLVAEMSALGILMGMRRDMRSAYRGDTKNEFFGLGSDV